MALMMGKILKGIDERLSAGDADVAAAVDQSLVELAQAMGPKRGVSPQQYVAFAKEVIRQKTAPTEAQEAKTMHGRTQAVQAEGASKRSTALGHKGLAIEKDIANTKNIRLYTTTLMDALGGFIATGVDKGLFGKEEPAAATPPAETPTVTEEPTGPTLASNMPMTEADYMAEAGLRPKGYDPLYPETVPSVNVLEQTPPPGEGFKQEFMPWDEFMEQHEAKWDPIVKAEAKYSERLAGIDEQEASQRQIMRETRLRDKAVDGLWPSHIGPTMDVLGEPMTIDQVLADQAFLDSYAMSQQLAAGKKEDLTQALRRTHAATLGASPLPVDPQEGLARYEVIPRIRESEWLAEDAPKDAPPGKSSMVSEQEKLLQDILGEREEAVQEYQKGLAEAGAPRAVVQESKRELTEASEARRESEEKAERDYKVKHGIQSSRALPVKGKYRVSSKFGSRKDPFSEEQKDHNGIDYAVPENTEVFSTRRGKVTQVSESRLNGKFIRIKDDDGYEWTFIHLNDNSKVKERQSINAGDIIGLSGNTGRSKGAHLHIQLKDPNGKIIDPEPFLEVEKLLKVASR